VDEKREFVCGYAVLNKKFWDKGVKPSHSINWSVNSVETSQVFEAQPVLVDLSRVS